MGNRGPVPKRSEVRVRANKPVGGLLELESRGKESPYLPDEEWHPIALEYYRSVEESGQSQLFEPSDWMSLYLLCENLSRLLNPQFIGMAVAADGSTKPMKMAIPLKGADMTALRAHQAALLMTEGDRRRMQIELMKQNVDTGPTPGQQAAQALNDQIAAQREKRAREAAGGAS